MVLVVLAGLPACGARSPLEGAPSESPPDAGGSTPQTAHVVLFGGTRNDGTNTALADTWTWDGGGWTQANVPGPPGRYGAAIAPFRGQVVLFGGFGNADSLLTDTWSWNGTSWRQLASSGPPARAGAVMAQLGDVLVLFGGFGSPSPDALAQSLGDTWTWDGTGWTQRTVAGPPPRDGAVMAPLGDRLVLFGGEDRTGYTFYADTWTWDGAQWTKLDGPGPSDRSDAVMAPLDGKLVLLGGDCYCAPGGGTFDSDTWTWDGASWTREGASGPALFLAAVAPFAGRLVVFGGISPGSFDDSAATQIWTGTSWTAVTTAGPSARDSAAMASP
jgi:N-acetylneuraminic acid mutarotase